MWRCRDSANSCSTPFREPPLAPDDRRPWGREADAGAVRRNVLRMGSPAVCRGQLADDGQPEAGARPGASGIGAPEALERAIRRSLREARAVVDDVVVDRLDAT